MLHGNCSCSVLGFFKLSLPHLTSLILHPHQTSLIRFAATSPISSVTSNAEGAVSTPNVMFNAEHPTSLDKEALHLPKQTVMGSTA